MNRVTYYSKQDLSTSINLERAEAAINNFKSDKDFTINDIIELYNIKLFFDNDLYLLIWTKEYKNQLNVVVNSFENVITRFFLSIDNTNIVQFFKQLEFYYTTSFWRLIEKYNVFKKVDSKIFEELSRCPRYFLREVLQQKNLTRHFSKEILQHFSDKKRSAEIIISYFEEEKSMDQPQLFFPFKIGDSAIETLINNYLDSKDPNLNYVRLIVRSRELKLSDKIKLKAKRLAEELEKQIFNKGNAIKQGITLVISETQQEPLNITTEHNSSTYSYGKRWLDSAKDPFNVLQNFAGLFNYINHQGCISLVSKQNEITGFEHVFTKSKNEFYTSFAFQHKHLLSSAQLHFYLRYLQLNELRIENILENVVNDFINSNLPIKNLRINLPTEKSTILEKIRMVSPELEFLIKQYKCFADEGKIDFELLEFSSAPLYLSTVKSRLDRKYVYPVTQELKAIIFHLFSPNALLHYIDAYQDKYTNFIELIISESVKLEEFAPHNQNIVEFLVSQDCVYLDDDKIVRLKNIDLAYIAKTFYDEDVISYYHQNESVRNELDLLIGKNYVSFENTLFTKAEIKYLNFHLNKKEFTNSLDLRNKYSHGTNSTDEDEQAKDYGMLLKLVVLVICKIVDDLILFERQTGANTR